MSEKWGNFSGEFRKGFHHEEMSVARKNDDRIVVSKPRISVLLSGTIKQVPRLIPDEEDGLFSRFLFFFRDKFSEYRSPFISNKWNNSLDDFFDNQSVFLYNFCQSIDAEVKFSLTDSQAQKFDSIFQELESKCIKGSKTSLFPTVRRSGIITFRIAMILTVLRQMDCETIEKELVCSDEDFNLAIDFINWTLKHAELVLSEIYRKDGSNKSELFLEQLPKKFTRNEAIAHGKNSFQVGLKSVEGYLTSLIKNKKIKTNNKGNYERID